MAGEKSAQGTSQIVTQVQDVCQDLISLVSQLPLPAETLEPLIEQLGLCARSAASDYLTGLQHRLVGLTRQLRTNGPGNVVDVLREENDRLWQHVQIIGSPNATPSAPPTLTPAAPHASKSPGRPTRHHRPAEPSDSTDSTNTVGRSSRTRRTRSRSRPGHRSGSGLMDALEALHAEQRELVAYVLQQPHLQPQSLAQNYVPPPPPPVVPPQQSAQPPEKALQPSQPPQTWHAPVEVPPPHHQEQRPYHSAPSSDSDSQLSTPRHRRTTTPSRSRARNQPATVPSSPTSPKVTVHYHYYFNEPASNLGARHRGSGEVEAGHRPTADSSNFVSRQTGQRQTPGELLNSQSPSPGSRFYPQPFPQSVPVRPSAANAANGPRASWEYEAKPPPAAAPAPIPGAAIASSTPSALTGGLAGYSSGLDGLWRTSLERQRAFAATSSTPRYPSPSSGPARASSSGLHRSVPASRSRSVGLPPPNALVVPPIDIR
eukprot:TRINITY_DN17275_c0_g1_i2.p1 TRINITY_DN17275_c0_g1~~TRINITY_DN17275_c0_g1_i2.p1  ORF type:complete len:487 (-),score=10.19 TRINITY_DN17275_c0_g1_i2:61-1521(-)